MAEALGHADEVVIGAAKQSASSQVEIVDTAALAADLKGGGIEARACSSNDEAYKALEGLVARAEERETLIVFLTNGSFGGIIDRLVQHANDAV